MREGWTYKKLGEVCETSSGGTPSKNHKEYYEGGTIPWLRSGEVGQGLIYSSELFITELGLQNSSAKIFPIDTVVIAMYGATVGQVGILKREMATNQAICGILPNESLYPLFLLYCLKSKKPLFLKDAVGGAQPNISQNIIKNTSIPIPPLSEQERIVSELDLLSGIIEKKKAQLKEYDQLAQSIFYDMFGDIYCTTFSKRPLIDICEFIKDGTHQTPIYTEDKENGIKFLSAKDVVEGVINWNNIKYIPIDLHKELQKRIAPQRNDLLLCKNGTTGICAIVETDEIFDIYVSLALIRPKKPFCSKYLLYAINNPFTKEQFNKSLKGVGVPNLHLGEIKKAKIIYPPLSLQQSFAEKIEAIERQKALIQQSITEVETLFNSRMDYYFN